MTVMAAPIKPLPAGMSEADHALQKRRYRHMLILTTVCCFAALLGAMGHVSMHQFWGLPLFFVALAVGFGAQIMFIVGLVKASRPGKGV